MMGRHGMMGDDYDDGRRSAEDDILSPLYGYGSRVSKEEEKGGKKVGPGIEFQGRGVENVDKNGNPILHVQMIDYDGKYDRTNTLSSLDEKPHEPSPPIDPSSAVDPDASWLACLARRARRLSSVTRWLVCLALFLCILSMIWICLAIIRTAPRRRVLYARPEAVKMTLGGGQKQAPPIIEKQHLVTEVPEAPISGTPPPPYTPAEEKKEQGALTAADPQI
jgi:hypothetical protein